MMEIRPVSHGESDALVRLYEQRPMGYEFDPRRADFIIKNGMFDNGKLVASVLGRMTTESYLLLDPQWSTPAIRWEATKRLIYLSAAEAKMQGVIDTYVSVSPLAGCFARRLKKLGFVKAPWPVLTARL